MKKIMQLVLFLAVSLVPGAAFAAHTGTQAIGLANWTASDVNRLADDYVQAGGDLELTFLPNEFNAGNPFGNATQFAQATLPRLNGHLRLTAYLWFHSNAFSWSAFSPGNERATFRQIYLHRVAAFDQWAKGLQAWAAQRGLSAKLNFVLCPYLEDDCASQTAYLNLLTAIRAQQRTDGISTPMRRSANNNRFRVDGLPLEAHGRYEDVRGWLHSGDAFSNDGNFVWLDAATVPGSRETAGSFTPSYGTPTSCADFIRNQRIALGGGVTVLLWRPAYNGLPGALLPDNRRNLTPLTGKNGALENAALLKVPRSR